MKSFSSIDNMKAFFEKLTVESAFPSVIEVLNNSGVNDRLQLLGVNTANGIRSAKYLSDYNANGLTIDFEKEGERLKITKFVYHDFDYYDKIRDDF